MINIAELLKDAPKGMKLYSPLFGEVKFVGINKQSGYPIDVIDCNGNGKSFTKFGVYFADHPDAECLLFPSKGRTWEGWKLPVKPNFKVGDWLYRNTYGVRPILVKDYSETQGYKVECERSTYYLQKGVVENEYHLWSIADAKDGDIIGFNDCTHNDGSYIDWVGIYKCQSNDFAEHHHSFHCVITSANTFRIGGLWRVFTAYPATKEQRDLLFAKMKDAGYQWDSEKKELRKIKPHYDIANFHAGMPVLVRDYNHNEWRYVLYSHYKSESSEIKFNAGSVYWRQCIPFEGNEHLLGTTDMPDEMYINW